MTYREARLREFGDNKHIVAYVEINNPIYSRIRKFKRVTAQVDYYNLKDKGKVIGSDFYFDYRSGGNKTATKNRLEKLLGVKLEGFIRNSTERPKNKQKPPELMHMEL